MRDGTSGTHAETPEMEPARIGLTRAEAWVHACRPKTLPAAVMPVVVGSALAASDGVFQPLFAGVALVCSLLIQIGTNLANDYFDFVKGADTEARIGPVRVVQSGLIPARTVRNAMIGVFAVTFLLGLVLVFRGGVPILAIGIAAIFFAVVYTAGPFPLAYLGLGDVFVFLFFGIVAVTGTYYVQALQWSTDALLASVPIGALTTAILVVNNYRDIDTDRETGKRTLAVRIGRVASRGEFLFLLALAYVVPVAEFFFLRRSGWIFLPLASLPVALIVVRILGSTTDGPVLNNALATTGRLLALFGLLYSAGILLS